MQESKQKSQSKPPSRITFGEVTSKNRKVIKILNDSCLPIKYSNSFYQYIEYGKRFAKLVFYKDVPIAAVSWKIDKASEHTQQKQIQRLKQVEESKKKKQEQIQNQGKCEGKKEEDQQIKKQNKEDTKIQQSHKGKLSKAQKKQKQNAKLIAQEKEKQTDDPNDQKMIYMMTITVLQAYRKMGFGYQILKLSEDLWKEQGYKTIILDVQISNQAAINFYKKNGFQFIREKQFYYTDLDPPHSYFFKKVLD